MAPDVEYIKHARSGVLRTSWVSSKCHSKPELLTEKRTNSESADLSACPGFTACMATCLWPGGKKEHSLLTSHRGTHERTWRTRTKQSPKPPTTGLQMPQTWRRAHTRVAKIDAGDTAELPEPHLSISAPQGVMWRGTGLTTLKGFCTKTLSVPAGFLDGLAWKASNKDSKWGFWPSSTSPTQDMLADLPSMRKNLDKTFKAQHLAALSSASFMNAIRLASMEHEHRWKATIFYQENKQKTKILIKKTDVNSNSGFQRFLPSRFEVEAGYFLEVHFNLYFSFSD